MVPGVRYGTGSYVPEEAFWRELDDEVLWRAPHDGEDGLFLVVSCRLSHQEVAVILQQAHHLLPTKYTSLFLIAVLRIRRPSR